MAKTLSSGSIDWADRAAVIASFTCMVHCLALPLVVAALPALATVLTLPETFHLWMLAFAAPVAALALLQGWSRHRAWAPAALGLAGLACLTAGVFLREGAVETAATVTGGLLLAGAHIANWRLRRACPC